MSRRRRRQTIQSTILGAALGAAAMAGLQHFAPRQALHAVASDSRQTFATATGPLQEDLEAFYFLDFLTGDLKGTALNNQTGQFSAFFQRNVLADLGVPATLRNPKFSLVTGLARLANRGTPFRAAISVVYVTEETTGATAAYGVPVSPNVRQRGQPATEFVLLDAFRFRNVVVRE